MDSYLPAEVTEANSQWSDIFKVLKAYSSLQWWWNKVIFLYQKKAEEINYQTIVLKEY